jgi:hypothetical protein
MRKKTGFIAVVALCAAGWCQGQTSTVTAQERLQWLNWLIPMPKEIAIEQKVQLPADQVHLRLAAGAGEVVQSAAKELKQLFSEKAGSGMDTGSFEILLGVLDNQGRVEGADLSGQAKRLKGLPYPDQGYVIVPEGGKRLIVAGLSENAVYYGVQTLKQLLEGSFQKPTVVIPLAAVTDWPDIEFRGYWAGFSPKQIEKLASFKYNVLEVPARLGFDEQGKGICKGVSFETRRGERDPRELTDFSTFCHLRGIKCVPYIGHLGHLAKTGIYELHPEVKGQGEHITAPKRSWIAPCTSHPKYAQILSEWMIGMASLPYVDEISVWMIEEGVFCSCPKCLEQGEYVAEMRAIVAAWRIAQQKFSNLKCQLLLTQGSYPTNDKVIAAAPKDLRIVYYDGGRSYDSSREPMIYPLLEKYAADGGWLGVYPQVTVSWAFVMPWSCPQFMKTRMTEFADKKLRAMIGYAHPTIDLYDFNVTAGGEWTWNPHGRSEAEFTQAWATRKGFENPQAVAEWTGLLGPATWNIYGAKFPYELIWFDAGNIIKSKSAPRWGSKGIFRYFKDAADLDRNMQDCSRALDLAKKIGSDQFVEETTIAIGYYTMLKAISQIMQCVADNPTLTDANKQQLNQCVDQLNAGVAKIAETLPQWGRHYGMSGDEGRLGNTIKDTRKVADGITKAVKELTGK